MGDLPHRATRRMTTNTMQQCVTRIGCPKSRRLGDAYHVPYSRTRRVQASGSTTVLPKVPLSTDPPHTRQDRSTASRKDTERRELHRSREFRRLKRWSGRPCKSNFFNDRHGWDSTSNGSGARPEGPIALCDNGGDGGDGATTSSPPGSKEEGDVDGNAGVMPQSDLSSRPENQGRGASGPPSGMHKRGPEEARSGRDGALGASSYFAPTTRSFA